VSELKRLPVKYIRDRAKSRYQKGSSCEICGTTEELQFHHLHTVDLLWEKWVKAQGLTIDSVDDILNCRDDFIAEHEYELYTATATLCKVCHNSKLHKVYGKTPALSTAEKQRRWIDKQRLKFLEKNK
jgi:5-methylcytosine-specific restriction endonuclease McrA